MNKENHFEYTTIAVGLYETLNNIISMPEGTAQCLAQGSWDEDEYQVITLDLQRLLNWHFYNNQGRIKNKIAPGVRTSEDRVEKLIGKIEKEKKRYRNSPDTDEQQDHMVHLLSYIGRLIHHVQDMSTFSHVVPVYHGPGLKDSYEKYGLGMYGKVKVYLDKEPKDPEDKKPHIVLKSEELRVNCFGQSEPSKENLFSLYSSSAEESLKILKDDKYGFSVTTDGVSHNQTWNSFWKEAGDETVGVCPTINNTHQGFGSFGDLCNNFGKESFDVDEKSYQVDPKEYLNIYKILMKKSIIDTLRTLNLVLSDIEFT